MNRIEKLREFLQTAPEDSFLQHALALEYIKGGDDINARLTFESLLNSNPSYVGSYYHLGKLLERNGETSIAISIYEKGMDEARKQGDHHALGELRSAYEELTL